MKPAIKKAFKILNYLVLTLVLLFVLMVAIVNLPAVHKVITRKANQVLADAGIPVHVSKFTLLINGKIGIEEVEIIAAGNDTIVYAGNASVNFRPFPLLFKRLEIESIHLDNVIVALKSDEKTGKLNLLSVFSSGAQQNENSKKNIQTEKNEPWEISLKTAVLKNIRFSYFDQQGGISFVQSLKKAQFTFNEFSILNKTIKADKITLEEPDGMVGIWSSEKQKEDKLTEPIAWKFALNQLNISNLNFLLDQPELGTQLEIKLKEGNLSLKNLDLAEQKIEVGEIELKQPEIDYISAEKTSDRHRQNEEETPLKITFPVFPWKINSEKIMVTDGSLNLKNEAGETDPELEKWLPISNLNFVLIDLSLTPDQSILNIEKLNSSIGKSIKLTSGSISFEADSAQNIRLQTNLAVTENTETKKWFGKNHEITFEATIQGSLNKVLQISSVELKESTGLQFLLNGNISGLTDFRQAVCDISFKTRLISREQLRGLLSAFGISQTLPDFNPFTLNGNIRNTLQHPFFDLQLKSTTGNISLGGNFNTKTWQVNAKGNVTNLKLAQLLGENAPQHITGHFEINERINSSGFPSGKAEIKIDSVNYNSRNIGEIALKVISEKNQVNFNLTANDTSLICNLNGLLAVSKNDYSGKLSGSFDINPSELNYIKKPFAIKGEIESDFDYSEKSANANLVLKSLSVNDNIRKIELGDFILEHASGDSSVIATIRSAVINADISSRATLQDFQKAFMSANLKTAFNLDSTDFINLNEIGKLNKFRLNAKLNYHEIFQFFYPDTVLKFNDINLVLEKNSIDTLITATLKTEKVAFENLSGENMILSAIIENNRIKASFESDSVRLPSFKVGKSSAIIDILPNEITGDMQIMGMNGEKLYGINVKAIKTGNEVKLVSTPEWIINGKRWKISPEEVLTWTPSTKKLQTNVNIFSNEMEIRFIRDPFGSFKLNMKEVAIDSLIPHEVSNYIPQGILNARVQYNSGKSNLLDFNLNFKKINLQNLAISEIESTGQITSDSTGILDGIIEITIDDSSSVNLELGTQRLKKGEKMKSKIESIPFSIFQPFLKEYIGQLHGTANGELVIKENDSKILIDGNIDIGNASMKFIPLGTLLFMPDNKLEIKNSDLVFNNFTVLDSLEKPMKLNGNINFSDPENMSINLEVKTDNLLLMNNTGNDKTEFFGTIVVNSGISIKGSLFSPEIRGNITLEKGTDVTYQMIQDLSVEANQTDVVFAGIDSSLKVISTTLVSEKKTTQMPNIQTTIFIDPKSVFKVKIADIYNVDISISGNGNLNYNMLPNNTMSLNGIYEITNGLCILKITGWPRKDFSIAPGSSFRWDGPIDNPELNLEATTKVRGSYLNPIDNKNRNVDFIVSMRLENKLANLDIVFNIKSEDQYISSVINTLSNDQLMRQAVNLLLFETIDIPGIQSSSNYMASQISSFWESQLNALTKTSLKKTELSFGIDTYDANSAAGKQEKTSFTYQMERKFMNDRATVKLSGKLNDYEDTGYQTNSLFENFIFEYALDTHNSKFIKLYQKKDYEDMLEGEVIKYGVGFLYRKNYDKMKDIWQRKKKAKNQSVNKIQHEE